MLRYINRTRDTHHLKHQSTHSTPHELSVKELHQSIVRLTKHVQSIAFHEQIKCINSNKSINRDNRNLIIDEWGVLRVGGRLNNLQNASFDKKHPMLLPNSFY